MLILRSSPLVAFESIARLGTVHAAAKELGFTQTAITLRLKQLETILQLTLFLRSRRGMKLTPEGQALFKLCKAQRELEGQFLSQITGKMRQKVSLTLTGPTSVFSPKLVAQVAKIYQTYPFLNLHLKLDDHSDLIELVRRGDADLAIVSPSFVPKEMDSKLLNSSRFLLVGPKAYKGKRIQDLIKEERAIEFYESDTTTERYLKHFGLPTLSHDSRVFANNNEVLIQLLRCGVGYGTLTDIISKPYLESGELIALNRGLAMDEPLALTWYPRSEMTDYFKLLIKFIC